jgi:release factor glutamine methyltransferase
MTQPCDRLTGGDIAGGRFAVAALLQRVADLLDAGGRDECRLKARHFLGHVLGVPHLELPAMREADVSREQMEMLDALARRAAAGEPLQYVIGHVDFYGRRFTTDRRALIPRPETEHLVETILRCEPLWSRVSPAIAEIGTGSGCIVVSLAAERPGGVYHAVDLSAEALDLARENARSLGVAGAIRFTPGDLLEGFPPDSLDAVASNPPYIAAAEVDGLSEEIRCFEPRLALEGGRDGLEVLRRLIPAACCALRRGGRLFLEVGAGQAGNVRTLMMDAGFAGLETVRDLGGHERVLAGVRA